MLVESTSDAHSVALDDLVGKRDRDELFDHIAKMAGEKCPKSPVLMIAAPLGAAAGLLLALIVTYWFGGGSASRPAELTVASTSAARTAASFRTVVFMCAAYYMIAGIALHGT